MKINTTLLLAASLAFSIGAQAADLALEPSVNPLDPAVTSLENTAPNPFEVRAMTLPKAKTLLASTEGPAWRVLQVQAPACKPVSAKKKSARKAERKMCLEIKAECKKADKFAHGYGKHAACSALYTQTTVLLTNDAPPQKGLKAPSGSTKAVKPKTHKH